MSTTRTVLEPLSQTFQCITNDFFDLYTIHKIVGDSCLGCFAKSILKLTKYLEEETNVRN